MVTEPTKQDQSGTPPSPDARRRTRIPQSDIPMYALDDALKIPQAIFDNYAARNTTPFNVASALKMLPNSTQFRMLCGSAVAYGLTEGGWNAQEIAVMPLCKRILAPTLAGDDAAARREAALRPRLIGEFVRKYDTSPLPRRDLAVNVLVEMGVPRERAETTYDMILATARAVGLIKEIKGKDFVHLAGVPPSTGDAPGPEGTEETPATEPKDEATFRSTAPATEKPLGQGIFVAHGKNKKPLDQLKKILDQFKIPYKVAVDEPNLGRPISAKVKETMESCNCAILIFTADDEFLDKDSKPIWRPSENVIYELGASSYLYEKRIVILKEDCIQLASNFGDLGYISFSKDQLDTKSLDLIKELIGFGILKIST